MSTISPKYKFIYINGRGLGEITRLLFAQAGVEYEDVRIEKDEWVDMKHTLPFGKLPILEIDGTTIISGSRAIVQYISREHGLAGKDNLEAAKCDMLVDALSDVFSGLAKWWQESNPDTKDAMFKGFVTEAIPPFHAFLNRILEENNGDFLVGDKLTYADVAVAHGLYSLDMIGPAPHFKIISTFPPLIAFVMRILELPNIKEWIDKRPVTEF